MGIFHRHKRVLDKSIDYLESTRPDLLRPIGYWLLYFHNDSSQYCYSNRIKDYNYNVYDKRACVRISTVIVMSCYLDNKPEDFGRQRCWGSIGWGFFSMFGGVLVDYFSDGNSHKNYTPVYYLCLIIIVCDFALARKIQVSSLCVCCAHRSDLTVEVLNNTRCII